MKVQFSDEEEFLAELRIVQSGRLGIPVPVRLTQQASYKNGPAIRDISVIAGFIGDEPDTVVELFRYIGQDWGTGFPGHEEVADKAEALIRQLEAAIVDIQQEHCGTYDVRAGAYR